VCRLYAPTLTQTLTPGAKHTLEAGNLKPLTLLLCRSFSRSHVQSLAAHLCCMFDLTLTPRTKHTLGTSAKESEGTRSVVGFHAHIDVCEEKNLAGTLVVRLTSRSLTHSHHAKNTRLKLGA